MLWHNMGVWRWLVRAAGMLWVVGVLELELFRVLPLHVAEGVDHPGSWSIGHTCSVKNLTH